MSDLTNQYIDESFQKLTQIEGTVLADGTGSVITTLDVTSSNAFQSVSSSYATTASFALNVTDPTWDAIQNKPSGLVSGSSQVVLADATGDLDGGRITGTVANATNSVSSSYSVTATSSSFANTSISSSHSLTADTSISSSHALNADNAIQAQTALVADTATNSTYADNTIVYGKNLSGGEIPKGTPLYFTGSGTSGNLVGVYPADAANPNRMPAAGIAGETLGLGAEGVVLLDGFINGVDTSLFQSGDSVYVAAGGGYTNQRPTGSNILVQGLGYIEKSAINGSGVIQGSGRANDVPNIQEGFGWFGNADGVATAQSTASFAKTDKNNVFTGTQTFDLITANSASFGYVQTITGSATIIGDSIIVLNNDTPTQRYAGIAVYDSGSTGVTASLQFDGASNDWFYEYSDDGGVTTEHGVALFGPEYPTKGTPTYPTNNTIQKGNGGHHLLDSSITDDGALVTVNNPLTVTGQISGNLTGNVTGNASTATTASHALNADNAIAAQTALTAFNATSSSHSLVADQLTDGTKTLNGSLTVNGFSTTNYGTIPAGTERDISTWNPVQDQNGNTFNLAHNLLTDYPAFGPGYRGAFGIEYWDSYSYSFGNEFYVAPTRTQYVLTSPSGRTAQDLFRWFENTGDPNYEKTQKYITADSIFFNAKNEAYGALTLQYQNASGSTATSSSLANFAMGQNGGDPTKTQVDINANGITFGTYGPNSGDGTVQVGNIDHTTFIGLSGAQIKTDGRVVSQNTLTPLAGPTHNLDLSQGNFFEYPILGDVVITPINPEQTHGQTINVVIDNGAGNNVSFSGVLWPGGTAPTLGAGVHVVTLLTGTGTRVLGTAVETLS